MPILLATVRNSNDEEVCRLEAREGDENLHIGLVMSHHGDRPCGSLKALQDGKLRLMMNGAVCLERKDGGEKRLLFVDQLIAESSGGQLRFAYNPKGVEEGHQLKRQIAMKQEASVPFSELVEIAQRSALIEER